MFRTFQSSILFKLKLQDCLEILQISYFILSGRIHKIRAEKTLVNLVFKRIFTCNLLKTNKLLSIELIIILFEVFIAQNPFSKLLLKYQLQRLEKQGGNTIFFNNTILTTSNIFIYI